MKKEIYNVLWGGGYQTLIKATSIENAKKYAEYLFGKINGPYNVRKATEDDINWVKMMGDCIHDGF